LQIFLAKIIVTALLAFGLYALSGGPYSFPPKSSVCALQKLTGKRLPLKKRLLFSAARRLEPFIHLSKYRHDSLEKQLKMAGSNYTPEFHTAKAIVTSGIYFAAGLLLIKRYPIISAATAIYAVRRYFSARKVSECDGHREKVENEIPRFTSYVVQSCAHNSGVGSMISGYREIAGEDLGKEMDILIADMRTGNPEAALISFESRMDSPVVSELVRGLIGIYQGEDMRAYMVSLEARMTEREISTLKKEASKRPDSLEPANWMLAASIMVVFAAVLGVQLVENIGIFT